MEDHNPLAEPGHNSRSPFDAVSAHVTDLMEEARHWLDGSTVDSPELAEKVGLLMDELRKADSAVDGARKSEADPLYQKWKAVNEQYKPLAVQLERAVKACKAALAPWLRKLEEERQAELRRQQEEADRLAREAAEKARAATASSDLSSLEDAEQAIKDAKKAAKQADKTAKARVGVGGGSRAVTMRKKRVATVTDLTAAARHYWTSDREALRALVQQLADRDAREGRAGVPGVEFTITEEPV